jgi:hypothetical protein
MRLLKLGYVCCLRTLLSRNDFKLDSVIFLQTLKAFSCDGTKVDEDVSATVVTTYEPKSI